MSTPFQANARSAILGVQRPPRRVNGRGRGDHLQRGDLVGDTTCPALLAGEAKVFAEAALRMLAQGELEQAAVLFIRAAIFARAAV